MKQLLATVVVLMAACTSSDDPAPDAPLPTVHDQLDGVRCDPAWASDAGAPFACEHACEVRPVDPPCLGKTPCNDQDPCDKAGDDVRGTVTCPSTFIAHDYTGDHQGCCMPRTTSLLPSKVIPTFYECPPK